MRVLKEGKAVSLDYCSVTDCLVRDLSETGARLKCADQNAVPDQFRLLLPYDSTIRDAAVVWRRADMIGVRFTGEAKRAPPRKW